MTWGFKAHMGTSEMTQQAKMLATGDSKRGLQSSWATKPESHDCHAGIIYKGVFKLLRA